MINIYSMLMASLPPAIAPAVCGINIQFALPADRDAIQAQIREQGVITITYYPVPLHLQEAYADLGHKVGDFPVSEAGQ
jgi:UDP-2-acetamido-2-deoxy-ribo-hexuluronate aminotransferase